MQGDCVQGYKVHQVWTQEDFPEEAGMVLGSERPVEIQRLGARGQVHQEEQPRWGELIFQRALDLA